MKRTLYLAAVAGALLPAFAPSPLRADGPEDNRPDAVRPVPPAGIVVGEADRGALEQGLTELAGEIRKLKRSPAAAARLADVEIFYRAVSGALMYGELFEAAEIGKAKALLETGLARARALAGGKTPWLDRPGPVALGYVSALDGSVQPYGVWLPPTWSPQDARRWRLDTWFHGRAEKLSEVNFISGVSKGGGEFTRPDAIVIQPYGRYCNGSKFAGEVDFFEALADLKARVRVDEDRIVVRGFSLGGATTWHLAAHYASDWAAAAPGAGFSETARFLDVFQNEKLAPTWWEQKLWQLYDAPPYAENFRNVPVVAYSGAQDKQKQAADVMAEALERVGLSLTHVVGPNTGHKYHPAAIAAINETVDTLAARGRDPLPRRVSLTTPTLRYNRQAWVTVDGLSRHWEKATVEAELAEGGPGDVRLQTKNVTALTLKIPAGRAPFFPGRAPAVVIDGQRIAGPQVASDRSWTAPFHRDGAHWVAGELPSGELRKRHGLQGPIDDAFLSSFMMVTPWSRPFHGKPSKWAEGEQIRALGEWRRHFRGEARVRRDLEINPDDLVNHNLVLWGDPSNNRVIASVMEQLPIKWTKEAITVGKRSYPADTHALVLVYPNPLNPKKYVVLNSGFTFREYDYLNNARQTPKLPDWAVVDVTTAPGSRYPGKIVDAGFFGERWEVVDGPPPGPITPKPAKIAIAPSPAR